MDDNDKLKISLISDNELDEKMESMFVNLDMPEIVRKKPQVFGDVIIPPNVVNMNAFSRYKRITNTRMEEELGLIKEFVKEQEMIKSQEESVKTDDEKIRTKYNNI